MMGRTMEAYGVALVGSFDTIRVFFAKEPYKRDDILQKRRIILSILLTVATPYHTYSRGHAGIGESCHASQLLSLITHP